MPNYIYDPFEHAPPLKHYVYGEQHEFDKELIKAFAIEYEKGTQSTSDGRPQIGTLRAIAPIICSFRYQVKRDEIDNSYDIWFRYSRNNRYVTTFNTGYTTRINRVIEHLARLGYLEHSLSEPNSNRESRFRFTSSFSNILDELKPRDIDDPLDGDSCYLGVPWSPEHEVYIKPWVRRDYDSQGRSRSDIRRYRVNLRNDDYKLGIARDLKAHNEFIEGLDIQVDTSSLDTPEKHRKYKEFQKRYPSFNRTTRFFRLFINEDLTQYGRFHGAWWQFLTSSLRPHLLINGKETIELDYGGLQPNILFSLNHVEVGDNFDPYKIKNRNRKEGEEDYHYRPLVKKCFMFIANGKTPERYLTSVKSNLTREINNTPPEELKSEAYLEKKKLRELLDTNNYSERFKEDLKEAWKDIWDNFQEEAYLWRTLTIKETEMTNNIHNQMRELGIPALSIHDSYIVPVQYGDTLKDVMISEFQSVLHTQRTPLIKEENEIIEDDLEVSEEWDYESNIYD